MTEILAHSPVLAGFLASLVAGLGTAVGAAPVFVRRTWGSRAQAIMLAFAGGIMLAAAVFSLTLPALEIAAGEDGDDVGAAVIVCLGILLGAIALWRVHAHVPHEHFIKGAEGGSWFALGRNWLFITAIALHNFPEGFSVGVAFGPGDLAAGLAVTAGIGIQNMPEGLAVAAALLSEGFGRVRAFGVALVTGLIEPVGGLVGAVLVGVSDALLPWALAFAAGAMLFVIVGEVIPETDREQRAHRSTIMFVVGFLIMMVLDVTLG
jgi:ZIP family zinc transporter